MKKTILFFGLGFLAFMLLGSMRTAKPNQLIKTKLQVMVLNQLGNLVEGATVKLYANKADYEASKNHIGNKNSDNKGLVVFSDLEEKVYYLNVEKGEANNFDAATQTDTLKASKTNKVKVIITE